MKALIPVLVSLLMASPAAALEASYSFTWNGVVIGEADMSASFDANNYRTGFTFRTKGVASLFARGGSTVTSSGAFDGDGNVRTLKYTTDGKWNGKAFSRNVRFTPDGRLATVDINWSGRSPIEHTPVPEPMKSGPDPLGLLAGVARMPLDQMARTGEQKAFRTFDGLTAFNWQLGCKDLPANDVRCVFTVAKLAGYTKDEQVKLEKLRKSGKPATLGASTMTMTATKVADGSWVAREMIIAGDNGMTVKATLMPRTEAKVGR